MTGKGHSSAYSTEIDLRSFLQRRHLQRHVLRLIWLVRKDPIFLKLTSSVIYEYKLK